MRVLVVGAGKTGAAMQRWAARTGTSVVVSDDNARASDDFVGDIVVQPDQQQLAALVANADLVVPNPAVPERHPVFALAATLGVPVVSEIELAWRELDAAHRTVVAITGTNGKTTVTTLVQLMLEASGVRAVAAGNIGHTLIDALVDDADVVVAEVSSFQLRFIDQFRPRVAVLLNIAQDHLDWHPSFDAYVEAKARIFEHQHGDDLLVFNLDDPNVAAQARRSLGRTMGFTLGSTAGAFHVRDDTLVDSEGAPILLVSELPRALPNDLANALAAAAAALAAGADRAAVVSTLRQFGGLPHRVTLVGQSGGVRFFDDSKATNPHATLGAVRAFDSVVLIAGGRNKGNDLGALRELAPRLRSVVAIGEAAEEVEEAFSGSRPVTRAATMHDAVRAAAAAAEPGDVVLLSPACASWDQYRNYAERGDDFAAEVRALAQETGPPDSGAGDADR